VETLPDAPSCPAHLGTVHRCAELLPVTLHGLFLNHAEICLSRKPFPRLPRSAANVQAASPGKAH
jgi:hypothetical protein